MNGYAPLKKQRIRLYFGGVREITSSNLELKHIYSKMNELLNFSENRCIKLYLEVK